MKEKKNLGGCIRVRNLAYSLNNNNHHHHNNDEYYYYFYIIIIIIIILPHIRIKSIRGNYSESEESWVWLILGRI